MPDISMRTNPNDRRTRARIDDLEHESLPDHGDVDPAAEILDLMAERVVRYRVSDLEILYCNAPWAQLFRVDRTAAIGRSLDDFLTDDGREGLRRQLALLGPGHLTSTDSEARSSLFDPDVWLQWSDRYVVTADGAQIVSVGRDVTAQRRAEMELAASETRYRELADHSVDVVWRLLLEPTPHFDYLSPSAKRITGYPPEFFLADFTRLFDIIDESGHRAIVNTVGPDYPIDTFDLRVRRPDGDWVVCETRAIRVGNVVHGISRDVTEVRDLQDSLIMLASRDPLTGLANRHSFMERLQELLGPDRSADDAVTVVYADLDGLKRVNDEYGHESGDRVLIGTADRLVDAVGDVGTVARIGGDEFAVLLDGSAGSADIVERIEWSLDAPLDLGDGRLVVPAASIGTATAASADVSPAQLVAAADDAMYVVKRSRQRLLAR